MLRRLRENRRDLLSLSAIRDLTSRSFFWPSSAEFELIWGLESGGNFVLRMEAFDVWLNQEEMIAWQSLLLARGDRILAGRYSGFCSFGLGTVCSRLALGYRDGMCYGGRG
jgi:hypothetical protein